MIVLHRREVEPCTSEVGPALPVLQRRHSRTALCKFSGSFENASALLTIQSFGKRTVVPTSALEHAVVLTDLGSPTDAGHRLLDFAQMQQRCGQARDRPGRCWINPATLFGNRKRI